MKFALVDNIRTEASPNLIGICPHCDSPMIPKCGPIKIHHWAHNGRKKRDCNWENETPWHRGWKNEFPTEWQEHSLRDESGKMHIADVFVPDGLAIEFQHSLIKRKEVEARTNFYPNICWIVDGLRLKTGWEKFRRSLWIGYMKKIDGVEIHKTSPGNSKLLIDWARLDAIIVFDFGNHGLWFVDRNNGRDHAYIRKIDKERLLELLKLGQRPESCPSFEYKVDLPW